MYKSASSAFGKVATAALSCVLATSLLCGCQNQKSSETLDAPAQEQADTQAVTVNVAASHGTSSIGLASFMSQMAEEGKFKGAYRVAITTSAEQILPALEEGAVDIALLPPSTAATYYNEVGGITVLAVNSLSPLALVTSDSSISSLADLADKTVYFSGAGAEGLCGAQHLLDILHLTDKTQIQVINEPAAAVATLTKEKGAVAFLAQPYASLAVTDENNLVHVVDLTDAWDALTADGSRMVGSVVVARSAFVAEHPKITAEFLAALAESSQLASEDPTVANPLIADAGILEQELLDERVTPGSHPVCIQGAEMKTAVQGFLQVLYDIEPAIVGDAMPADDFYYGV